MPNTMKLIDVFAMEHDDYIIFNTIVSSCPKNKQVVCFDNESVDNHHKLHIQFLKNFINHNINSFAELMHFNSIHLKNTKSSEEEMFLINIVINKNQIRENEMIITRTRFGIYKDNDIIPLEIDYPKQKQNKVSKKIINNIKNQLHIVLTKAVKLLSIKIPVTRSTITNQTSSFQDAFTIPSSVQHETTTIDKQTASIVQAKNTNVKAKTHKRIKESKQKSEPSIIIIISKRTRLYKISELHGGGDESKIEFKNIKWYKNEPKTLELYNVERYRNEPKNEFNNIKRYKNEPKTEFNNIKRYKNEPKNEFNNIKRYKNELKTLELYNVERYSNKPKNDFNVKRYRNPP